jgi:dCTP diphosphatase
VSNDSLNLREVREFLESFAVERDWVKYHTPKNLAMALAAEAGELVEIFQWMTPGESSELGDAETRRAVGEELADVLQYLIRLADVLDLDLEQVLWEKLRVNEDRFPV